MILDRADQAITATDLQRDAKAIFNKLQSGEQDRFVVMRNGKPEFVLMPVTTYESIVCELMELRSLTAADRGPTGAAMQKAVGNGLIPDGVTLDQRKQLDAVVQAALDAHPVLKYAQDVVLAGSDPAAFQTFSSEEADTVLGNANIKVFMPRRDFNE